MSPFEHWTLSDQPADWINTLLLCVTTVYVIFTGIMMKAALRQARSADETARMSLEIWKVQRLQQLLPIQTAIVDALHVATMARVASDSDRGSDLWWWNISEILDASFEPEDVRAARDLSRAVSHNVYGALGRAYNAARELESARRAAEAEKPLQDETVGHVLYWCTHLENHLREALKWLDPLIEPLRYLTISNDALLAKAEAAQRGEEGPNECSGRD